MGLSLSEIGTKIVGWWSQVLAAWSWLPRWFRVTVAYLASAVLLLGLTLVLTATFRWVLGFFPVEVSSFTSWLATGADWLSSLEGQDSRLSQTLGTGLIAASYAIVQLTTLLTIEPLLRCGAKRWWMSYATLSAVIAGVTFFQFHDVDMVKGMGVAAPLGLGLFYPAVIFRMLGKFDIGVSEGDSDNVQQIHANLLAIFVAGIRRNSLRYWAYVSAVLEELPEPRRLRLLLGVLANPNSLRNKEDQKRLFEEAQWQLAVREKENDSSGSDRGSPFGDSVSPSPLPADATPVETVPWTDPATAIPANPIAAANTPAGQTLTVPYVRWTTWQITEKFHLVGSPELVLDAVEPEIEALWLIAHMPLGEQVQLVRTWFETQLSDSDRQTLIGLVSGEAASGKDQPTSDGSTPTMAFIYQRRLIMDDMIRRYATRELYDNVVCEYRKRRFRCWGLPSGCWKRRRAKSHCQGCDGGCPDCRDR